MLINFKLCRCLLVATIVVPELSFADSNDSVRDDVSSGVYIGVSAGYSQLHFEDRLRDGNSTDEKDSTYSLLIGFRFNDRWRIEGGWLDLGEHSGRGLVNTFNPETGESSLVEGSVSADVSGILMRGIRDFNIAPNAKMYVHVGGYRWEQESTITIRQSVNQEKSGHDLVYGVGAAYSFFHNYQLNLEWQRHGLLEADVFSLGINYQF